MLNLFAGEVSKHGEFYDSKESRDQEGMPQSPTASGMTIVLCCAMFNVEIINYLISQLNAKNVI